MPVDQPPMSVEMQHHMIEVSQTPSVRLYVVEAGPENPQRTIIFVHGYGGWSEHWQHQLNCFKETARVIAFDLRGHSRSDKPRNAYTLEIFERDLERLLTQLKIHTPVTLVGHSIGAAIVSEYALKHPGAVEKLILINPSINYAGPAIAPLLFMIPDVIFDFVLNIINKIRFAYSAPSYVLKSFYREGLIKWQAAEILPHLRIPTLILASTSDPVFSQQEMQAVHEFIEHSLYRSVEVSSHMTMVRRPDVVNSEMARFFEVVGCRS